MYTDYVYVVFIERIHGCSETEKNYVNGNEEYLSSTKRQKEMNVYWRISCGFSLIFIL